MRDSPKAVVEEPMELFMLTAIVFSFQVCPAQDYVILLYRPSSEILLIGKAMILSPKTTFLCF